MVGAIAARGLSEREENDPSALSLIAEIQSNLPRLPPVARAPRVPSTA